MGCLSTGLLAACTDPPELPVTSRPDLARAEFPTLVPIEQILGAPTDAAETDQDRIDRLDARVAGLQARANRLQGSGIDPALRDRLDGDTISD